MNVDKQPNGHDCGLYSIAFATLLFGEDPAEVKYETGLGQHFRHCVDQGQISPFPSLVVYRQPPVITEVESYIYCHCRCPDDGSLMVQCEECQKWFHAECENVKSEKSAKIWKKCHLCVKRGQRLCVILNVN